MLASALLDDDADAVADCDCCCSMNARAPVLLPQVSQYSRISFLHGRLKLPSPNPGEGRVAGSEARRTCRIDIAVCVYGYNSPFRLDFDFLEVETETTWPLLHSIETIMARKLSQEWQ